MSAVEDMVKVARTWRGLAKLVVLVPPAAEGQAPQALAVKLGEARRRWARVASQLAGVVVLQAQGFDEAGELVGTWEVKAEDLEDEADAADDEESIEADEQRQHRQHTQWVIKEVSKIFEVNIRLSSEMVHSVVDLVRALRTTVASPAAAPAAASDDEASRTLGMLLSAVMANQNNNNTRDDDGDEKERDERRKDGNPSGQGESFQPDSPRP